MQGETSLRIMRTNINHALDGSTPAGALSPGAVGRTGFRAGGMPPKLEGACMAASGSSPELPGGPAKHLGPGTPSAWQQPATPGAGTGAPVEASPAAEAAPVVPAPQPATAAAAAAAATAASPNDGLTHELGQAGVGSTQRRGVFVNILGEGVDVIGEKGTKVVVGAGWFPWFARR